MLLLLKSFYKLTTIFIQLYILINIVEALIYEECYPRQI